MKFLNKKSRLVLEVASSPHRRADILHQRNQLASWVEDPSSPDSSCPRVRKNERKRKKEINSSFFIQFLKVILIYFIPTKWQQWDFFYIATLLQQHTFRHAFEKNLQGQKICWNLNNCPSPLNKIDKYPFQHSTQNIRDLPIYFTHWISSQRYTQLRLKPSE